MQKKTIQAKFLFSLRKLSLNITTNMQILIKIKRNDRFMSSQKYMYDPTTQLLLNQTLQFKTTVDKVNNKFQSKALQLKVYGRNPDNKEEKFQMTTNIQLSEIAEVGNVNKTFRVKNKTDTGSLNIDCRAQLRDQQSLSKPQSSTSLQACEDKQSTKAQIQRVKSMQNIPRKKQKNLVISDQTSVNEFDPDTPPNTKSKKPFVSKSSRQLGTVMQQNQGESAISDKKSIAIISDDNKSFKSKTENQYITSMNNMNTQTTKMKDQIKGLRLQLDEYRDRDTKNKRKIKELEQKIELFKITEQKGESGSQMIIKRLHQEIETKVKEIRMANEESDKAIKLRRKEEETSAALRKELGQLKLEKQKILFQYKYSSKKQLPTKDIANSPSQDIQKLKLHYQQQIQQLKQQIKQKTKLLTTVQPSSSPNLHLSECFSKQCDQSKKQQQKQIKKLHKRIQQLTNKLQTKDKLISNYEQMQDDRKNQYNKGGVHKQFEKWKAERLVLEQEIQLLRSNTNSNFKNTKQLSNIQEELVTYKVERQNANKELQGLRKNLGVISKEKEKLDEKYQNIERHLIDQKQRMIYLLNAVQEIGGMQMFDEISKFIE